MQNRKLLLGALAGLAVVLVTLVAFALRPPPPRVTLENFRRIEEGMIRPEVEAILGPPMLTGPTTGPEAIPGDTWSEWIGPDGSIVVVFHGPKVASNAKRWDPNKRLATWIDVIRWRWRRFVGN